MSSKNKAPASTGTSEEEVDIVRDSGGGADRSIKAKFGGELVELEVGRMRQRRRRRRKFIVKKSDARSQRPR
jgi:hypothetical protein